MAKFDQFPLQAGENLQRLFPQVVGASEFWFGGNYVGCSGGCFVVLSRSLASANRTVKQVSERRTTRM